MIGDRTSELWLKIDGLHIKYLQAEETPAKLEIRKILEGYVTEYLNEVPYDHKFLSIRTGDTILQSARWIHGFSFTKAASAFLAIERYAANLINQPWRQEFWSIKQYSGFYKDSVQSSLSGVEKFFYDMGYREIDPYCMDLSSTKHYGNPVNVDAVTSVARDCLLASGECNILADIHNGVSLQFQITMKELLEFRQDHIGTAKKAIEELIYRKNQICIGRNDVGRGMIGSAENSQEDGQDRSIKHIGQRETPQRTAWGSGYTQQKQQKESPEGNFWLCRICTFHNRENKSICEICGETMDQPTARKSQIDAQNYDGGLTCNNCTLRNEEAAKFCEACGATLGMVYSAVRPTRKSNRESLRSISQLEFPPLC